MWLRRFHRTLGLILAPFLLVTATCGGILLWRKAIYARSISIDLSLIEELHNFEILSRVVGTVLAAGLALMAITGPALRAQIWLRKRKARS